MPESAEHIYLVHMLEQWVCKNILQGDSGAICVESPETCGKAIPPPVIDQYRPDIYVNYKEIFVIGEAKTEKDLECIHSKRQFESYMKTCEIQDGKSYLIVAVPCFVEPSARNMLKIISKRLNVQRTEIRVISRLIQ